MKRGVSPSASVLQPPSNLQPIPDWHQIIDERAAGPVAVSRDRLRWILGLFAAATVVIFLRAVELEISDGANFRRLAARPIERTVATPAPRGRILARDGSLLAADRQATALAVQFRYLENPPDPAWLRQQARSRLSSVERRKPERVAAMESQVRSDLAEMHRRLARLCRLTDAQWQARTARIARRVTALAALVNERRRDRFRQQQSSSAGTQDAGFASLVSGLFAPPESLPPPSVTIVEQTAFHRIVEDVPSEVVEEIRARPERYPGTKIVEHRRRDYPAGMLAAHVVGHVGRRSGLESQVTGTVPILPGKMGLSPSAPLATHDDVTGLMGVERRFDDVLTGQPGSVLQTTTHGGDLLASKVQREPIAGRDVVLSIDPQLQRSAESWLDRHLRRARRTGDASTGNARGGAIVVMDVHSGELLVAACVPRFDPNVLVAGDPRVEAVLADPRQPLFDRVAKMALPPGSVFKPLTALALVSEGIVNPLVPFDCQGYLDDPERLRCQLFRQHGVGHGDVSLADALAQSCNVYFFHHVGAIGGVRLVDWAARFGFAQPTGVELAEESSGELPGLDDLRRKYQTQMLAVGQGAFTATPLQVVRLYAAIANGGYLVTPRVTREAVALVTDGSADSQGPPSPGPGCAGTTLSREGRGVRVAGLTDTAIDAVREGLRRVVDDPQGSAYATVRLPGMAIAGKTGTAETGGEQEDHSWFAGYVPADAPRYAFVVVLQHAGSGAEAAGPIARNLVERLRELGYLGPSETADKSFPPGKG